jgi:hypothetical protein
VTRANIPTTSGFGLQNILWMLRKFNSEETEVACGWDKLDVQNEILWG